LSKKTFYNFFVCGKPSPKQKKKSKPKKKFKKEKGMNVRGIGLLLVCALVVASAGHFGFYDDAVHLNSRVIQDLARFVSGGGHLTRDIIQRRVHAFAKDRGLTNQRKLEESIDQLERIFAKQDPKNFYQDLQKADEWKSSFRLVDQLNFETMFHTCSKWYKPDTFSFGLCLDNDIGMEEGRQYSCQDATEYGRRVFYDNSCS
jgi:hypothetical protein